MKKVLHNDVTLSLNIDPDFTGIFLGFAHDESEGCELKGNLEMHITRKTVIKELITVFSGICKVNFKIANSLGVPMSDGQENHFLIRKTIMHFDGFDPQNPLQSTEFEPGTYKYPFLINIPPFIPHSFKGKHGSIEYELSATAFRSSFSTNLHISRPIVLRRCLMNELDPTQTATQTVCGTSLNEILSYSASASSMVYSEGGLLKLDLGVELHDPHRHSVRMVTCGLQERVFYRTMGKTHYVNDFSFPLGCSTFLPSKHPDYNPANLHNYNAIFRLYPRVQTDNKSRLIVVQHALLIRLVIDDNQVLSVRRDSTESARTVASIKSLSPKAILSGLTSKQDDENEREEIDFTPTPSSDRSPSIADPIGSAESSFESGFERLHPFQSNIVRVSSRKSGAGTDDNTRSHSLVMHHHHNPLKFNQMNKGSYESRLSVPVIVTSRQEYREGSVPALPNYKTTIDEPPSYLATLQNLPPVPIYPFSENN